MSARKEPPGPITAEDTEFLPTDVARARREMASDRMEALLGRKLTDDDVRVWIRCRRNVPSPFAGALYVRDYGANIAIEFGADLEHVIHLDKRAARVLTAALVAVCEEPEEDSPGDAGSSPAGIDSDAGSVEPGHVAQAGGLGRTATLGEITT